MKNPLRGYNGRLLAGDFFGGAIAALIALPYGLAMASLMGLPPILGLYTSLLAAPICALLGRNPVLIGGTTVRTQIIPVSGTVLASATGSVLVPFFSPIPATMLSGIIRVTFHVEGNLDDGSTVRTSEREYIFVTCSTAGCNSACL